MRLIILLVLGGFASYIGVMVAITMIPWHHSDKVNAQRLRMLQNDGVLRCDVAEISPWHEKDERHADTAGSTHGIGFGGRTLTSVTRMFSLNGADPSNVIGAFAGCAQSNGWRLVKQPYVPLRGIKSFADGWTADLNVYVIKDAPFTKEPLIQINLSADPI
jgi:hypothetical protein